MADKPKTAEELIEELEDLHAQEDDVMDKLKKVISGEDFDDFDDEDID
jgi:hypothetical protein|tara:strand:- start:829 stop:972 length:144 start_codon:yes stop_codon:yes gene_type:complete